MPLSFSPLVLGLSVLDFSGLLLALWGGLLRALLGARGAGLRGAVCGTGLLGVLLGAVARRAPSTGLAGILLGALGSGFLRLPLLGRMCWRRGFLGRRFGGLLGWRCGGILGLCGRRGTFLFGSWGGLCFRCLGAFLESLEAPGIGSAELVAVAWSFIS